jgi:hypothetical protein
MSDQRPQDATTEGSASPTRVPTEPERAAKALALGSVLGAILVVLSRRR